jgi:hypothetical protein
MKIKCEICGELVHIIESHIIKHGYTVETYRAEFPGAPLLSSEAMEKLRTKIRPNGKHKKFSIKKTFGVQVSKNFPEVTGYENPSELTPAIDPDYHFHDKSVLGSILYAWKPRTSSFSLPARPVPAKAPKSNRLAPVLTSRSFA